jgi:hypothetical protein
VKDRTVKVPIMGDPEIQNGHKERPRREVAAATLRAAKLDTRFSATILAKPEEVPDIVRSFEAEARN